MDAGGRLRLDAVARYLQDAAGDDVDELAWGAPLHLWVMRRIRVEVVVPFVADRQRRADDVVQRSRHRCGRSPAVARRRPRRTDRGRQRVGPPGAGRQARPARRELHRLRGSRRRPPRVDTPRARRSTGRRTTDAMAAASERRRPDGPPEQRRSLAGGRAEPRSGRDRRVTPPFAAVLEYRGPIDLGDQVDLAQFSDGGRPGLALVTASGVKAVARLEQSAL